MALKKISGTIRQFGLLNGALYAFSKAVFLLTRGRVRFVRYYIIAQPIPPKGSKTLRASEKTFTGQVNGNDPIAASFPRPSSVIHKRFEDGNICIVAKAGEKFAGFLWLALDHYDENEVRCRFWVAPPECAWDFDIYVEPEFRLGRTLARLWDAANSLLAERGVLWSYSQISSFNPDSLRAHARLGGKKVGSASFLCLGDVQITFATVKPHFHISSSPGNRANLHLNRELLETTFPPS